MSRGLGDRQRLFLAAMVRCEQAHGPSPFGVNLPTWEIVNAAGALGLSAECAARKVARDADYAAWKDALDPERRARLFASPEDREARIAGMMAAGMIKPQSWREARRRRTDRGAEDIANPTRVLALLERRGLVMRMPIRGPGAYAMLTAEGRRQGEQELAARLAAPPTEPPQQANHPQAAGA